MTNTANVLASPPLPVVHSVLPQDMPAQARDPTGFDPEEKRLKTRVLPDLAVCRAQAAGFGEYADCLVEHPYDCPHALSFGFACLCNHPDRAEIVRRTVTELK